jgi:hypothetical protein
VSDQARAAIVERLLAMHEDLRQGEYDPASDPDWHRVADAADEIEALQTVVRLLVDRFHDETPMGPNVIDLPDVRWRILPPHVAGAVRRAMESGSSGAVS